MLDTSVHARVNTERQRQLSLWGDQSHHPSDWLSILGEEYGEVCQAYNSNNLENYKTELIQVAAVAIAAIHDLERKEYIDPTRPDAPHSSS